MFEPIRVLILEDSPVDVELIKFELQEGGLSFIPKVVMTEDGFVHELEDFCPDIILSDYDLPTYNGSLALDEAKRRCPDIPFVLVTGAITEDRAIEILTQGAKDYVLKHRLQQRLAPAIRRALTEKEEHRTRTQTEEDLRKAYRVLQDRDKIRTEEREAEMKERKKMEKALRMSKSRESSHATELRRRAIERMKANKAAPAAFASAADSQKLLQELQIYQIELEMQNEELRQSKEDTDALLAKYLDIYDFAPIGYLTLNRDGAILEANLAGANLLGIERSRLNGHRFGFHVSDEFRPIFNAFFRKTFEGETSESCEGNLENEGLPSRFVRLHARLSEDRKECRLAIIDITSGR